MFVERDQVVVVDAIDEPLLLVSLVLADRELFQVDAQVRPQAAGVVLVGLGDPRGHARPDRNDADAHAGGSARGAGSRGRLATGGSTGRGTLGRHGLFADLLQRVFVQLFGP